MFCYIIIVSVAYFLWKETSFSAILKTMMVLRYLVLIFCVKMAQKQDFYCFYDWGTRRGQNTERRVKSFMLNVVHSLDLLKKGLNSGRDDQSWKTGAEKLCLARKIKYIVVTIIGVLKIFTKQKKWFHWTAGQIPQCSWVKALLFWVFSNMEMSWPL